MKRTLTTLIIALLILPASASAAIASVLTPVFFNTSVSKDLGTAANRVVFVTVTTAGADVTQTPTIAGVNMTAAAASINLAGVRFSRTFYYINPPSGSQTVDPKNAATMDHAQIFVLSGVDQTTPIEDIQSGGATSASSVTVNVTVSTVGAWVGAQGYNGLSLTSVSGVLDNASKAVTGIGAYSNATVSTGTASATVTQSGSDNIQMFAFSIKPAAGSIPPFWWAWDF